MSASSPRAAPGAFRALEPLILVLFVAVVLGAAVRFAGAPPREAFGAFFQGALFSSLGWGETAARAAVLACSALAVTLSFRAGVFNIGAEGQYLAGAVCAAALAQAALPAGAPGWLAIPALILVGAAAGAAWSLVAGVLRERRGVSEVISTLMLNLVAALAIKFLVQDQGWLHDPATTMPQGAPLPATARLPGWGGTDFHAGVLLALPLAVGLHALLWHSRAGLHLRATGFNPAAARACGIPVSRVALAVFAGAGALAGLGGALDLLAFGYLTEAPRPDAGYMAIAVALAAGLRPLAVVPAAVLFAALETGARSMERSSGVPSEVIFLVQGVVILALLSRGLRLPGSGAEPAGAAALARGEA